MSIEATAVVSRTAELGTDVGVGPYSIIEDGVSVGDGCRIGPHVVLKTGVTIGCGCQLDVGAVLGSEPQDRKFQGEESFVRVGDNNIIREYVTIHRATGAGEATVVGNGNFLMACCHVGHNVEVGNDIMIAGYTGLSGHCVVHDSAVLGGLTGIHQYVTIGRMAMVGGCARIARDVPPFTTAVGNPAEIVGLNSVGLRRHGIDREEEKALRRTFRMLYRSELNISDAIAAVREQVPETEYVRELIEFVERIGSGRAGRQVNP